MVKIGQISMGMPSGTIIQAPLYFVKGHIPDKKKIRCIIHELHKSKILSGIRDIAKNHENLLFIKEKSWF
jgi:hypothetical protein